MYFKVFVLQNIIIQFGEFTASESSNWLLDLLIAVLGAAIGSGATIWAVYLTFSNDKKKDEKKNKQFQIEKIKYFQALIINITAKLKTQISNIEAFILTFEGDPSNIPLLEMQTFYELDRIVHKINQEEYYHSYLGLLESTDDTIKEFRNIYSLLDFFESTIKQIQSSIKLAMDFDFQRKTDLNTLVQNTMDLSAKTIKNEDLENQEEIAGLLNDVFTKYYRNLTDHSDLKYLYDGFIHEAKIGLLPFSDQTEVHDLLIELKKCTHLYSGIQYQNNFLLEDFKVWIKTLSKSLEKFESCTKRLLAV